MPPWVSSLLSWLSAPTVAATIGAASLLLTAIGFAFTLYQVRKSRNAAEAAAATALQVRKRVEQFDAIAECASAIQALEEIERLHRVADLARLPDRYTSVKKSLIAIHSSSPGLKGNGTTAIQSGITQLGTLKDVVEKYLATGTPNIDPSKCNKITSTIITALTKLSIELRRGELEADKHGV